ATHYAASMDESLYFKWNQSLKALGDHDRANQVLSDYYAQHYGAERVDQFRAEMSYLGNVRAIGERFDIENLPLNGPNSEFGALRVDSTLFYSAARKNPGKLYRWNNQKYLDIYAHPYDGMDLGDSLSVGVSKSINTKKRHEGTFAITQDGKTLYFTRNARKKTKPDKIKNLKIFRAEKIDGKWKNIQELPFNGKGFSTEHPALSPDGGKLYFASDREGGFGSFDIYWVTIQSDGTYGPVMNLGKEINTDKKEQFPFLDGDGNLYFSSNGHPGFGLLDVFVAKNSSGVFEGPDNMGLPMNSGHDDFSVSIDPGGGTGYFSSNRPGGKGSDDIYSFVQIKPLIIEACSQYIAGTLRDRTTDLPLAHAGIQLFDAHGNLVQSLTTDDGAEFRLLVGCGTQYRIDASKEGYLDDQRTVVTDTQRKVVQDGSLTLLSIMERDRLEALVLKEKQEEAERLAKTMAEQQAREEKKAEQKRVQLERETAQRKAIAQEKNVRERQMEIERAIENEPLIVRENGR